jgi:hypothetical protein
MIRLIRPTGRKYWKDQFHAYGWEIGFSQTAVLPSGKKARMSFRDIGVNRNAAINNALRKLRSETTDDYYEGIKSLEIA